MTFRILLLTAIAATLAVLLPSTIPLGIPGEWTWPRHALPARIAELLDRSLPALIAGAAFMGFAAWSDQRMASAGRAFRVLLLSLLVIGSVIWQHAARQASPSPHRELRPLWVLYDRYASGYFFEACFELKSATDLLSTYEARMREGDVLHEGTHPPGLFLLSWWALQATHSSAWLTSALLATLPSSQAELFRTLELQAAMQRPLTQPELAALWLLSALSSLLAAMTVLPAYGLVNCVARHSTGDSPDGTRSARASQRSAWRAAIMTVPLPAIAVFSPRSDVVYAFTGMTVLWLLLSAMLQSSARRRAVAGVLAGIWLIACLLVSLVHLPVLAAAGAFGLLTMLDRSDPSAIRRVGLTAGWVAGTAVVCVACWSIATDCNLPVVWLLNLRNHAAFYESSPRTWWQWMLVNPCELSLAAGMPVTLLATSGVCLALGRLRRPSASNVSRLTIALFATSLALWLSGKNMGEAARLWCFLTPWVAIVAATGLSREWWHAPGEPVSASAASTGRRDWLWLLASQLVVCALTAGRVSGYLQL